MNDRNLRSSNPLRQGWFYNKNVHNQILTRLFLNQETQCTTTAVFNKMEDIPNSMLCVSMTRGLSIIEKKIEVSSCRHYYLTVYIVLMCV